MINIVFTVIIILYGLSLSLYMSEVANKNLRYGKTGYRFLLAGFLLQSLIFASDLLQGFFPFLTLYDVLFFYSLILIFFVILIDKVRKLKLLKIVSLFFGLVIFIGAVVTGETTPAISSEFLSKLLFVHILFSLTSYFALLLSAIFSMMYIIHDYLLKKKIWNLFSRALPSLETLAKNSYYANIFGVGFLFSGLVVGSIWASLFYNWTLYLDPKVLTSFIIVFIYSAAIINRQRGVWNNLQLAVWNSLSFLVVILNMLISNFFESFHRWL